VRGTRLYHPCLTRLRHTTPVVVQILFFHISTQEKIWIFLCLLFCEDLLVHFLHSDKKFYFCGSHGFHLNKRA
jgi:hypothetical protein